MPPLSRRIDANSASGLRASLLGHPAAAPTAPPAAGPLATAPSRPPGRHIAEITGNPSAPPTPPELLGASPALQRLCESYHRSHGTLVSRSRRQRIGLFGLVAGLGVAAVMLSHSGTLAPVIVSRLVLAVAGSCCASIGLLALLWLRDERRLRTTQGDRLLRAIQSNCELPADRLMAFRRLVEPTAAFFACYEVWRAENHRTLETGISALIANFKGNKPLSV